MNSAKRKMILLTSKRYKQTVTSKISSKLKGEVRLFNNFKFLGGPVLRYSKMNKLCKLFNVTVLFVASKDAYIFV